MSYTPTTWKTGDVNIPASALNNMEGGIDVAANPFIVTLTPTAQDMSGTMDKTPAEIDAAIQAGRRIQFSIPSIGGLVDCSQYLYNTTYSLWTAHANIVADLGAGDMLLHIASAAANALSVYSVYMFPLTPMS